MKVNRRMQDYTIDFEGDLILTKSTEVLHDRNVRALNIINLDRILLGTVGFKAKISASIKALRYIW